MTINAMTPEGVCFDGLYLHRAKLMGLSLNGASFVSCDLRASNMEDAQAKRVNFSGASLIGVDAARAYLHESVFHHCRLNHTNFKHADLSRADLSDAEISDTNFEGCNLRGTTMLAHNLHSAHFKDASFDRHTILPEEFKPLEHGAILMEDETA